MSTSITVIKRDDSKESFDKEKIIKISVAAGLTKDEALAVADKVIENITQEASKNNNEILSTKIRDIFLNELRSVNKYAAGLYEWYEKSKTT